MATPYKICLVTTADEASAKLIATGLVEGRFAACVNIIPKVLSVYRWEDKIENSSEHLLVIKTKEHLREDVEQFVKKHHTYKVPEIIFLDIAEGSHEYLDWLGANTLFTSNISKDRIRKEEL